MMADEFVAEFVHIVPIMIGPDYTGVVKIAVVSENGSIVWNNSKGVIDYRVDLWVARELFGKLGEALKVIDANMDVENR